MTEPRKRPAALEKKRHGPFRRERCADPPPPELRQGVGEFNRGHFYAQHETLELLWRAEHDDVRYLYQGVLLVGIGCYHIRQGNFHGAVTKLAAGIELLRWFTPACLGVDVTRLVADAAAVIDQVRTLGPERLREFDPALFPKVHFVAEEA